MERIIPEDLALADRVAFNQYICRDFISAGCRAETAVQRRSVDDIEAFDAVALREQVRAALAIFDTALAEEFIFLLLRESVKQRQTPDAVSAARRGKWN